ncbi:MAG: translation initiation factor IF-3 [bacterium]|nr:translation initiation factor IF-3 [bacterium]
MGNKYYRTNQNIRASEVRVIGEDGKQVGVLPIFKAIELAREKGLDLVEIATTAKPPVVKITDFKKFLYQEEKKERETKKKAKGGELKGIRLTPFMAKGDLEVRIRRAEEFLKDGDKIKVSVRFMGRQMGKRQFGYETLNKMMTALEGQAQADGEPKWMGRELNVIISPIKGANKENKQSLSLQDKNAETQNQKVSNEEI